ncbi:MAG: L-arabinose isomerase [Mycoplasmatales bacterium]
MGQIWFITGSQDLYGKKTLEQVKENSIKISNSLSKSTGKDIIFKKLVVSKNEIDNIFKKVNYDDKCIGVILFAHTFSPAKMWVNALSKIDKPVLHLHTQFNKAIPPKKINMDYMNLHQSAHGDRELAHGMNVAGLSRDVVVGHFKDKEVVKKVKAWSDACVGIYSSTNLRMVRFGDNMNCVAVTDGNKVMAEKELGWTINTVGISELVKSVNSIKESEIDELMKEYKRKYTFAENCKKGKKFYDNVRYQAKLELGIEKYLIKGKYNAFTTNFDVLEGLDQLPGLASQRLMSKGYGFAGEGDWRTSALVYIFKQMTNNKGTSFMEDYSYDFEKGLALQAHMLEICPTISKTKPTIEVHELGIGGKDAPARLTFKGKEGKGFACSLVELNGKYRMLINKVNVVKAPYEMPNLPVAATFWKPAPNLEISSHAWLLAGGAHHTIFTTELTSEQIQTFTKFYDIQTIIIDENTNISQFEKELKFI